MSEIKTIGQVIDSLKLTEVAVKLGGRDGIYAYSTNKEYVGDLYIDPNDYILKDYATNSPVYMTGVPDDKQSKYVIVPREEYEKLK